MPRSTIHLINRFEHLAGSEMRALQLAVILLPHAKVRLWATGVPNSRLRPAIPIEVIKPRRGRFPLLGNFVFVGVYFHIGRWVRLTRPSRRIIIFNTTQPEEFAAFEHVTSRTLTTKRLPTEIVYATDLRRPLLGRPGVVQDSPIDLQSFRHRACRFAPPRNVFRVGRLSRDVPVKFHAEDRELFSRLAEHGADARLMGGACLKLPASRQISVIRPGTQTAAEFLQALDCFVYRTDAAWLETFGRVVLEAMACGLPVVVGRIGGYAKFIRHGVNGYLFDTTEEAIGYVLMLWRDPELRRRIGDNARQTTQELYSSRFRQEIISYYTRPTPPRLTC